MAQILAIDYGKVRCGIAVTDDSKIIASALETVETAQLMSFLKNIFKKIWWKKLSLDYLQI